MPQQLDGGMWGLSHEFLCEMQALSLQADQTSYNAVSLGLILSQLRFLSCGQQRAHTSALYQLQQQIYTAIYCSCEDFAAWVSIHWLIGFLYFQGATTRFIAWQAPLPEVAGLQSSLWVGTGHQHVSGLSISIVLSRGNRAMGGHHHHTAAWSSWVVAHGRKTVMGIRCPANSPGFWKLKFLDHGGSHEKANQNIFHCWCPKTSQN